MLRIQRATFTHLFIYLNKDFLCIYYSVPGIMLSTRVIMENKTIVQAFIKLNTWWEREAKKKKKNHMINAIKS